jgi:hypothetical protein
VVDGVVGWAIAPPAGDEAASGGSISPSMAAMRLVCVVISCLFVLVVLEKEVDG